MEHLGVEADKVTENASFIDDLVPTASTRSNSSWLRGRIRLRNPDDAAETILRSATRSSSSRKTRKLSPPFAAGPHDFCADIGLRIGLAPTGLALQAWRGEASGAYDIGGTQEQRRR